MFKYAKYDEIFKKIKHLDGVKSVKTNLKIRNKYANVQCEFALKTIRDI